MCVCHLIVLIIINLGNSHLQLHLHIKKYSMFYVPLQDIIRVYVHKCMYIYVYNSTFL